MPPLCWWGAESFDTDKNGHIDANEVQQVLKNLKMFKSVDQVKALIKVPFHLPLHSLAPVLLQDSTLMAGGWWVVGWGW